MNEDAKARWRKRLDGLAEPPETSDDRILRRALSIPLLPEMAKDQEPLGADSGLTLFSDEIGDFVVTVQVINATEVADGHGRTQNQG